MRTSFAVIATLLVTAGCAGNRTTGSSLPRADRATITAAEIAQYGGTFSNLYDYVDSRHREWFEHSPGATTIQRSVNVYLDGVRVGSDFIAMRQIPLNQVALARRLTPSEAEIKYGSDNNAGAIDVYTTLNNAH